MALLEDFAPYFAEFGVRADLDGEAVDGIFDRPYGDPYGVATGSPMWQMPTAQVPTSTAVGAPFTLAPEVAAELGVSTHWRVRSIEPDGTGVTTIHLELVG